MAEEKYRGRTEADLTEDERVRAPENTGSGREGRAGDRKVVLELQGRMRSPDGHDGMDEKLRRRLAEVLSSAGVNANRVALEVLFMLPAEFVRGYSDLFHRALNTTEDGMGSRNDSKAELGKATGSGARSGKGSRGVFLVRDDKAMGEKERVDRTLRKLARSMRDGGGAGTGKETVARCGEGVEKAGCGKWVEAGWKFCPYCGADQKVLKR